MLLISYIASLLPAVVKYLQFVSGKAQITAGWEFFLASGQELMFFGMLTVVILVSNFVFCMEYHYNTASYIFTSSISTVYIFVSKMICLLAMIASLFIVAAISQLLFGFLALKAGLSWILFYKFIKVIVWYIFSYFLVSAIVVMIAVLIKRFVVSAVIILGYILLVFPFHLKNNPYISPFMIPTIVASRIYGTNNYVFTNYYKNVSANNIYSAVFFFVALAIASLVIGLICYKRIDALK
jgi:ABC-2 type transport system permease protein